MLEDIWRKLLILCLLICVPCKCESYQCKTQRQQVGPDGLPIRNNDKSFVDCRAFATPNQPFLDRVRCCVDPQDIRKMEGTLCTDYSLLVFQDKNHAKYNCSVTMRSDQSEFACCETENFEDFDYNVMVLSHCADDDGEITDTGASTEVSPLSKNIVFTEVRDFTAKDQELDPLSNDSIVVKYVTATSVTIAWPISECEMQSLMLLTDAKGGTSLYYNVSCAMPPDRLACYQQSLVSVSLENLVPNSVYNVSLNVKFRVSSYWSKPTYRRFRTKKLPSNAEITLKVLPPDLVSPRDLTLLVVIYFVAILATCFISVISYRCCFYKERPNIGELSEMNNILHQSAGINTNQADNPSAHPLLPGDSSNGADVESLSVDNPNHKLLTSNQSAC